MTAAPAPEPGIGGHLYQPGSRYVARHDVATLQLLHYSGIHPLDVPGGYLPNGMGNPRITYEEVTAEIVRLGLTVAIPDALPAPDEAAARNVVRGLCSRGAVLIPLREHEKSPLDHGWPTQPGMTEDAAVAHLVGGGNLGINLGFARWIVLDTEDAAATAAAMAMGLVPTVITANAQVPGGPKNGGAHFYLQVRTGVDEAQLKSVLSIQLPGGGVLDYLAGARFVVAPPSRVYTASGYAYGAAAGGALTTPTVLPEAPAWLLDATMPAPTEAAAVLRDRVLSLTAARVRKPRTEASDAVTAAVDDIDWEDWLDGDRRVQIIGVDSDCRCDVFHWDGASHERSGILHDGCGIGYGVHVFSGTLIGEWGRDHGSRLQFGAWLRGVSEGSLAEQMGVELHPPLRALTPEDFERSAARLEAAAAAGLTTMDRPGPGATVIQVEVGIDGLLQRAAGARATAARWRTTGKLGPETTAEVPQGADAPQADGPGAWVTRVPGGLPAVHPDLDRYAVLAGDELTDAEIIPDRGIAPSSLLPADLRPLRAAVFGPRGSHAPLAVPTRDAAVAQVLAKAVAGKLIRDVARSTRAAQVFYSWDGTRWVIDPDAARVVVDALICTHNYDADPAVRQMKVIPLGSRKPTAEEEAEQRQAALEAALKAGQTFDPKTFAPQLIDYRDTRWADAAPRAGDLSTIMGRQPGVAISDSGAFDADPHLLGAPGRYIRLGRTTADDAVTVCAPDPTLLVTKTLGVGFDPTAGCPQWETFLATVLPDPEVVAYLQRGVGGALLGAVRDQVLLAFTGDGANGKGVVTNVLLRLLGDYGVALDSRVLAASSEKDHPAQLMPLRGARVAIVDELPEGVMWAMNLTKRLTGGSRMTSRGMGENPVSWDPTHTIILTTNGRPLVPPGATAFWRRYREINFPVRFATTAGELRAGGTVGMADTSLGDRLLAELPGILTWALAGYRDYLERGLDEPEAVLASGRAARAASSGFASFAAEMFTVTDSTGDWLRAADLWEVWTTYRGHYTDAAHQRPTSARDLPAALIRELGTRVQHQRSTGGKTPARLVGLTWSDEGRATLAELRPYDHQRFTAG